MTLREQQGRACPDADVKHRGPEKTRRIDLGLALLQTVALPGVQYTHEEIAAWCGCTNGAILLIEQKALKKLRAALLFRKDPVLAELVQHFTPTAMASSQRTSQP